MTDRLPYILVAERSVLPTINCVVESLKRYGSPASITTVIPHAQQKEFRESLCGKYHICVEEEILPHWPIDRIESLLPAQPSRAGWYLQQFLKLNFGIATGTPRYIVWDADTVMLKCPAYRNGERVVMNVSREYHKPYFQTYSALFGRTPVLARSVIAQYMLFETAILLEMRDELERRHGQEWIEAVLRALPGTSASEFSEYETYANYHESRHPGTIELRKQKWFRYGREVFPNTDATLEEIACRFSGYDYVAFERHASNWLKRAGAKVLARIGR